MLDIREVAAALGGEIVDGKVCVGETTFKVYNDDIFAYFGGRAATDWARARLGIPPRPPAAPLEAIHRIWYSCILLTDIDKPRPAKSTNSKYNHDYVTHRDENISIVLKYLRARGINVIPEDVGVHPHLWHSQVQWRFPAMVAARRDVSGEVVAVHRTYLSRDGEKKANLYGHPVKMDLGSTKGTCIRLAPLAEKMLLAEGIENALSVSQVTGIGALAAGSAAALRTLILPPQVRHVIILVDGDTPGRQSSIEAGLGWRAEGRRVDLAYAPDDKDFNDLLVEGRL